jgi:hypothetical protein
MVSVTPRPRFTPGNGSRVLIVQEAGGASEPVCTQRLQEKSFASAEDRTPAEENVTGKYTLHHKRRRYFTTEIMKTVNEELLWLYALKRG